MVGAVALSIDDRNTALKQMVDRLVDRDRKTLNYLQPKSAVRQMSAATIHTAGTAAPRSVDPNHVQGHMLLKLCKESARYPNYSELLHDSNIEDVQSRLARCLRRAVWDVCTNAPWSHERYAQPHSVGGSCTDPYTC